MFKLFNSSKPSTPVQPQHEHDWELVAVNDKYHTTYTDTNKTKHWQMRFYKCDCGERKFSDDRTHTYIVHEGIDKARANWIDAGVVPQDSYHPSQSQYYVKIDDADRKALDPLTKYQQTLEDIQSTLLLVTRNIDLEEKYPELKESYQKHMDMYRELLIAEKLYATGKK
jgi:hypothetical protein